MPIASFLQLRTIMNNMEKHPGFTILKNDTTMQAVVKNDASLGGVIFYKAEKIRLFNGIEVDKPCIVMMKKEKGILRLSLSDPTQKLEKIRLTLDGKFRISDPACNLKAEQGKTILLVSLPKGGEAGKTVTLNLNIL